MKSESTKSRIGDYVELQRGTTYKGSLVGSPGPALLGLGSIAPNGGFRDDGFKTYGGDCPQKLMLSSGDLYVSLKDVTQSADLLGAIARVPSNIESGRLTQDTVKLEVIDDTVNTSYLYWLLRTPQYRAYCKSHSMGTTNLSISRNDFLSYPVPEFTPDRQAVVQVLDGVEEKIELNRKQNRALEAIAQALFKRWFVEFEFPDENGRPYQSSGGAMQPSELGEIPVGWEVSTFVNEFNIVMGQSPSGKTYNESGEGMVFFQGRTDFGFRFPDVRMFCTDPKKQASKGDVLLSVRAPVGDLNIALEDCCIGRGLAAVKSKYKSYAYYKLKDAHPLFLVFETEGTVFGSISKAGFEGIESVVAPKSLIQKYNELVEPIDQRIVSLTKEICTLTNLRDTLLPKLMSGELRVA